MHKVWCEEDRISVLQKEMHSSNYDGNTTITIRRKELQYKNQVKGSKLKIAKKQNKYLLTIINECPPHGEITNKTQK